MFYVLGNMQGLKLCVLSTYMDKCIKTQSIYKGKPAHKRHNLVLFLCILVGEESVSLVMQNQDNLLITFDTQLRLLYDTLLARNDFEELKYMKNLCTRYAGTYTVGFHYIGFRVASVSDSPANPAIHSFIYIHPPAMDRPMTTDTSGNVM